MQLEFIASKNFISSIAAMNFYNFMDLTLYLIFICMYFLVLKNTHRTVQDVRLSTPHKHYADVYFCCCE